MGPILLSSEHDIYWHFAFIVVVVLLPLLLHFLEQKFIPDLGRPLLKSRILLKFHNSTVVGIIPTAQPSTAFCSESDHFVQLHVALYC